MAWFNNSAAEEYNNLRSDNGSIKIEKEVIRDMKKGKSAVTRAISQDAASIAARRKLRDSLRKTSIDLAGIRDSTKPLADLALQIRKDCTEIAKIETAIYALLQRVERAYDSTSKSLTKGQARQKFNQIQKIAKDSDNIIKQVGAMAKKERDYEKDLGLVDKNAGEIARKIGDYINDLKNRFREVSKANRQDARHVRKLIKRCIEVQIHAADVADKIGNRADVSLGKSYEGLVGMRPKKDDSFAHGGFKMTASSGKR